MPEQIELFGEVAGDPSPKPKREYASHMESAAIRRNGPLPEGWAFYAWKVLGGLGNPPSMTRAHMILMEAGPFDIISRGPRKGRRRWLACKNPVQVVVSFGDVEDERARYEREEDKCHQCSGHGEDIAGWNIKTGTGYRTCPRCAGTGRPPVRTECATND